jgi:hypothetical protein
MTQRTREEVLARVELFCVALAVYCNQKSINSDIYKIVIEAQVGKKNVRIVRREQWINEDKSVNEAIGGSAHCFIDLENGNVLKADGWKRPAPQIRGNIFSEDFDIGVGRGVSEYGAAYLK